MSEYKKFNILMCSRPGDSRRSGPSLGYIHHILAYNTDKLNRFYVEELFNLTSDNQVDQFDIFWFYAKCFDPRLYHHLKEKWPNKKFVFGQNVLLDKPDLGISDQWERWFIDSVDFDLYLDQVKYYNDYVKQFFREELKDKADYLDKCVVFDIDENVINNKKNEYDCLLYDKKLRYDDKYDEFKESLISQLQESNISFKEITYGKYDRSEYFQELTKCRCCVNLSMQECPGLAMYEAMHMDVPVIGSPHSVPSIFDKSFWVLGTDEMTDRYIKRNDNAANLYVEKIKQFVNNELPIVTTPRDFVLHHAGYERYCNDTYELLTKYCGE